MSFSENFKVYLTYVVAWVVQWTIEFAAQYEYAHKSFNNEVYLSK